MYFDNCDDIDKKIKKMQSKEGIKEEKYYFVVYGEFMEGTTDTMKKLYKTLKEKGWNDIYTGQDATLWVGAGLGNFDKMSEGDYETLSEKIRLDFKKLAAVTLKIELKKVVVSITKFYPKIYVDKEP